MAVRLDISQSYYNKLENGKMEMSISMMFNILEILEMDIPELFGKYPQSIRKNEVNV